MKSYVAHMKNKYALDGHVQCSGSSIVAVGKDGEVLCAVQKGAHGAFECAKDSMGARDEFSLDPLPEHERLYCLGKDGKVCKHEKYDERLKAYKAEKSKAKA